MSIARSARVVAVAAALATLAALSTLGAAAAVTTTSTPANGVNLVKNGGAEGQGGGPKACDQSYHNEIPHWYCNNYSSVVRYGTPGFPSTSAGNRINGGTSFFYMGPFDTTSDLCGDIHQDISISGRSTDIDHHHLAVHMSGYASTRDGALTFKVLFLDYLGNPIGTGTGFDMLQHSGFAKFARTTTIPANTRTLQVVLAGDAVDSIKACDVYFDKIVVKLKAI